jgi:hypothetical protein
LGSISFSFSSGKSDNYFFKSISSLGVGDSEDGNTIDSSFTGDEICCSCLGKLLKLSGVSKDYSSDVRTPEFEILGLIS